MEIDMHETAGEMMARKAREPSTWQGIGWLLAAVGLISAEAVAPIVSVGVALAGIVDVVRRER